MDFLKKVKKAAVEMSNAVVETAKDVAEQAAKKADERAAEKAAKLAAAEEEQQRQKEEVDSGYYIHDGILIVSTMEGMKTWLTELGKDTTPALMQTLQTQLQVLKYAQSPSLTGMALDNMILCLDKAIRTSTNSTEQANIKEAFASMIQNYFFMFEANLRCAQIKNAQESAQLLSQAGEMLSDAVTKTAAVISGNEIDTTKTIVKNVFESPQVQSGYIKKLFAWIGDKKILKQKEEEFYQAIESLFETFDENSELLGKSILYNGMLSRYRKQLVKRYQAKKMDIYISRGYKIDSKKVEELTKGLKSAAFSAVGPNKLGALTGITQSLGSIAGLVTDYVNNKSKEIDILAYCDLQNALNRECEHLKKQFEQEDALLEKLKSEQKEAGFFNFSEKKDIQEKIDRKKAERDAIYEALTFTKEQLAKLRQMFPDSYAMKEDIEKYETNLRRIEQKF